MKTAKVSLALVLLILMVGCASQSWQAKGTAVYTAAGDTIKAADRAFQDLKIAGLVTNEQALQYNDIYKKVYDGYWLAGDGWKLAMRAGSDIEQKKYLEAFNTNFSLFQKFAGDLIVLVNGILAKEGAKEVLK